MATIVSDFTGADENPLSDGGKWSQSADSASELIRLSSTTANGRSTWSGNAFDNTQSIQITIGAGWTAANRVRLYVREQDVIAGLNGYLLVLDATTTGECRIKTVVNGTESTKLSTLAVPSIGDVIKFEATGTTVNYYLNAVLEGTWTDTGDAFPSGQITLQADTNSKMDSCQVTGAILTGPSINNIDSDDNVFDGQTSVAVNGAGFLTFGVGSKLELTNNAGTVIVDQLLTAPDWADTLITIPTIIRGGLKYTNDNKVKVTDNASASGTLPFTLSTPTGYNAVNVVNPISDNTSVFFGASPAVATGDQAKVPDLTDQGGTLVLAADGTFTITGGGNTHTFELEVWDATDSTWSNTVVQTINGNVITKMASTMAGSMTRAMVGL